MDRNKVIAGLTATAGLTTGLALGNMSDQALLRTSDVVTLQQEKFVEEGVFEQILPGGLKPSDAKDKRTIENFPDNVRVDVYDGPAGKGYTVIEELDGKSVHVSYGPEASHRSKILDKSTSTATSTNAI